MMLVVCLGLCSGPWIVAYVRRRARRRVHDRPTPVRGIPIATILRSLPDPECDPLFGRSAPSEEEEEEEEDWRLWRLMPLRPMDGAPSKEKDTKPESESLP